MLPLERPRRPLGVLAIVAWSVFLTVGVLVLAVTESGLFVLLGAVFLGAAIGLWRNRWWGYGLAGVEFVFLAGVALWTDDYFGAAQYGIVLAYLGIVWLRSSADGGGTSTVAVEA